MASFRGRRVESFIQREIADLIVKEVKDPRITYLSTTVTHVKISNDLRIATVYVSIMGDDAKVEETMKGLDSARGFIQSKVGKVLRLRFTPEIKFKLDDSLKEGDKIIQELKKLTPNEE